MKLGNLVSLILIAAVLGFMALVTVYAAPPKYDDNTGYEISIYDDGAAMVIVDNYTQIRQHPDGTLTITGDGSLEKFKKEGEQNE